MHSLSLPEPVYLLLWDHPKCIALCPFLAALQVNSLSVLRSSFPCLRGFVPFSQKAPPFDDRSGVSAVFGHHPSGKPFFLPPLSKELGLLIFSVLTSES